MRSAADSPAGSDTPCCQHLHYIDRWCWSHHTAELRAGLRMSVNNDYHFGSSGNQDHCSDSWQWKFMIMDILLVRIHFGQCGCQYLYDLYDLWSSNFMPTLQYIILHSSCIQDPPTCSSEETSDFRLDPLVQLTKLPNAAVAVRGVVDPGYYYYYIFSVKPSILTPPFQQYPHTLHSRFEGDSWTQKDGGSGWDGQSQP